MNPVHRRPDTLAAMTSSIHDHNPFANWAPDMNTALPPTGPWDAPALNFLNQYPATDVHGEDYTFGGPSFSTAPNRKRRRADSVTQNNPIDLSDTDDDLHFSTRLAQQPADPPSSHVSSSIVWTADKCLEHALAIFPGISRDYVLGIYHRDELAALQGLDRCNAIMDEIMNQKTYPKQKGEKVKGRRPSLVLKDPNTTVLAYVTQGGLPMHALRKSVLQR